MCSHGTERKQSLLRRIIQHWNDGLKDRLMDEGITKGRMKKRKPQNVAVYCKVHRVTGGK